MERREAVKAYRGRSKTRKILEDQEMGYESQESQEGT